MATCTMWCIRGLRLMTNFSTCNKFRTLFGRNEIVPKCYFRHKSSNTIKNKGNNSECSQSFEKMMHEKRRRVNNSVLIYVKSLHLYSSLYTYCQKFGNIVNTFHYTSNDKDFIFMEYEEKENVKNLLSATKVNFQLNGIPVISKFLQFQDFKKGMDNVVPAKLNINSSINEHEIMQSLQEADSVIDQMTRLHQHIQLSDEGKLLRFFVCHQLELALSGLLYDVTIFPFGSTVNGFGKANCDLDMVLSLENETANELNDLVLSAQLYYHTKQSTLNTRIQSQMLLDSLSEILRTFVPGCNEIQRILHARVPIIKFYHDLVNFECDLSISNLTGVYMSELLYLLGKFDNRLNPLMFTVLKWAKEVKLTQDTPGKWITNFSLCLMVIAFLQLRPNPILPSLSQLQKLAGPRDKRITFGIDCTFLRNVEKFPKMKNNETTEELLLEFFHFYYSFNYELDGLSLISGGKIPKRNYAAFDIENPLETELNVSKNVSLEEVERIREKMKNAMWKLENFQYKSNKNWGLLEVFNDNLPRGGKMLLVRSLFDKTNEKFQDNVRKNEKINNNGVKTEKCIDEKLVKEINVKKVTSSKDGNSGTRKKSKNRGVKMRTLLGPWTF